MGLFKLMENPGDQKFSISFQISRHSARTFVRTAISQNPTMTRANKIFQKNNPSRENVDVNRHNTIDMPEQDDAIFRKIKMFDFIENFLISSLYI